MKNDNSVTTRRGRYLKAYRNNVIEKPYNTGGEEPIPASTMQNAYAEAEKIYSAMKKIYDRDDNYKPQNRYLYPVSGNVEEISRGNRLVNPYQNGDYYNITAEVTNNQYRKRRKNEMRQIFSKKQ